MADFRIIPASGTLSVTGSATMIGSGSTSNTSIFSVNGNNGRLFEVTDDLSTSIFSANTIAGLPVIEAFADNSVGLGKYGVSGSTVRIDSSGSFCVTEIISNGFCYTTASSLTLSKGFTAFDSTVGAVATLPLAAGHNKTFRVANFCSVGGNLTVCSSGSDLICIANTSAASVPVAAAVGINFTSNGISTYFRN